jgi:hypothetical protein
MQSHFFSTGYRFRKQKKTVFFIIGMLLLLSSQAIAGNAVTIPEFFYQIDHSKKLILVNEDIRRINGSVSETKKGLLLDEYYMLPDEPATLKVGVPYPATGPDSTVYTVYFTQLPLIEINSPNTIADKPRVLADFTMSAPDGTIIHSQMGIEIRGGHSQSYPKTSFRIEFWEEPTETDTLTRDFSLLGMRNDDDWNLQAMYNEPLRIRNKTSFQLWEQIHQLYYQELEPDASGGVQMEYAELFLNGEYRGIYAVGERIDRKQLQLKKYDGTIRGELYKATGWGISTLYSITNYDNNSLSWDGIDYRFPEEETDWINLYGFIDFVVHEDDYFFYTDYPSYFETGNAVDYFIFLNLLRASDNTGKNIYTARYDQGEPYFYVPWDLDGVLGLWWDGTNDDKTTHVLSNGLFDRLLGDCRKNGFYKKLQNRWFSLRKDILSHENIMNLVQENVDFLMKNGVYEREELAWEEYGFSIQHLDYISGWLTGRLSWLDNEFNKGCIPPEGFSFDDPKPRIELYPNPATEHLNVKIGAGALPFKMQIFNLSGYLLYTGEVRSKEYAFNLPPLKPGLYFVVISNAAFTETQKLIIR